MVLVFKGAIELKRTGLSENFIANDSGTVRDMRVSANRGPPHGT